MDKPLTPTEIKTLFGQDLFPTPGNDFTIFRDVLERVKPKSILESGFFSGGSSYLLLHFCALNHWDTTLISIDPMGGNNPEMHTGNINNVKVLHSLFPGKFTFIHKRSEDAISDLANQSFDLFNIDGDHSCTGAMVDFDIALSLNIPWLLVDDFIGGVREAYDNAFSSHYFPVKVYERDDSHNGKRIPRVLMRRRGFMLPDDPVELPGWK